MPSYQTSQSIDELQLSKQAVFQEPLDKRLFPPDEVDLDQWATHLAYISAQEPGNLLNHVRRVYLHLVLQQPGPLYGALLDLYLVLGDKGGRLRHQLLHKARKLLSQEEYDLFLTHYERGLQSNQPLPVSQHSVFGNFFSGNMLLAEEKPIERHPVNRENDPLELAREELNYGDITVAQQILEEALLQSPKRLGLHYSLLEIYKHTRSLDDLLTMKERLGDNISIAQAAWNQMQKTLKTRGT
jgi:tetratricopeptide (TPR) repeat protein